MKYEDWVISTVTIKHCDHEVYMRYDIGYEDNPG